jgi:hypothetical protein
MQPACLSPDAPRPWQGSWNSFDLIMPNLVAAAGVFLLAAFAPFEVTTPIWRLPGQSITNLEALLGFAIGTWAVALVSAGRVPAWREPAVRGWLAFLAASALAAAVAPAERVNAWHMTGRLAAAAAVFLLTSDGVTSRVRLHIALAVSVGAGIVVSTLAVLEYWQVEPALRLLRAFRPGVSAVGAQIRASGTLQYPTITSMYLEVVFAFGLGLMLAAIDSRSMRAAWGWFAALVLIADAIVLTFTRAGLITMLVSLAIVGAVRARPHGFDPGSKLLVALLVAIVALVATSRSVQSTWLRLTTEGQESWYRARVNSPSQIDFTANRGRYVAVQVSNTGLVSWDSTANPPVLLSYHWFGPDGDRVVAFEGERTDFPKTVAPGETVTVQAFVRAPSQAGAYRLEWDVVQEGLLWFSTEPNAPPPAISRAEVTGVTSGATVDSRVRPTRAVRPGRLTLWAAAVHMVEAYPLLGVGPDNFRLLYGTYAGLPNADTRTHSNNMYLEILAGGGLLTAIAFAWLVWTTAGLFANIGGAGPIPSAIAAAGAAIGIHGLVDSFLSFAPTYILFAMTLGYAAVFARGMEPSADAHRV